MSAVHPTRPSLAPEDYLFAALLNMVLEHCSVPGGKIDSFIGYPAHVTAMRLLAEAGFIEIESEDESAERVVAHVLPAAQELAARVEAVHLKERIRRSKIRA
ncbi:MAG: hypothetical protein ACLPID_14300 [Beijerinckiaceae bacterium]